MRDDDIIACMLYSFLTQIFTFLHTNYVFLCKAQFGAISKEVHEIMRIKSGNKRSMINDSQRSMINDSQRSIFSLDDGSVKTVSQRRISEKRASATAMRVKGRLSMRLSRKISNTSSCRVLDTLEEK